MSPLDRFRAQHDIADPLYGTAGGAGERAALRETVAHLSHACSGLLNYLLLLQRRWAPFLPLATVGAIGDY